MANNEQLIADLGEAINLSNASQLRFGANNDSFNRTINAGLAQINATIRDIDGLLGQIMDRINELKARIAELQGNGGPGNAKELALLKQQLADAQNGQIAATDVMNRALVTLRSNTEAMDGSIAKQDEPAMTAQLKSINDSLLAMQARLRGILNDNTGSLPPAAGPEPEENIVGPGMNQLDGGSRRRRRKHKTLKKSKRTKTNKKKKGSYRYITKRRKAYIDSLHNTSNLGRGGGRGTYKKRKQRKRI